MTGGRGVGLAIAVCMLAASPLAHGKGTGRRLAVLEVRAGAEGASDLGLRLALILRRTTAIEVIDGDDARQKLGGKIDEELSKCGGEPPCIAKIGHKLRAEQVLLVGVSELGDLIVALQLVDVKTGKVAARLAESLPKNAEPDDNTLEGYLRKLLPRADFLRYGTIRVTSNIDGATVELDGIPQGRTPIEPMVVKAPAIYDVRVRKKGYADFTIEIEVPPDAMVEVKPRLEKRMAAAAGWYQKWWVWAIAGTVVTGAVVGGVLLSGEDPSSVPVVVAPF